MPQKNSSASSKDAIFLLVQKTVENITNYKIPNGHKIYQNWNFWYETTPTGNPASSKQNSTTLREFRNICHFQDSKKLSRSYTLQASTCAAAQCLSHRHKGQRIPVRISSGQKVFRENMAMLLH
jgi:hypothetical protein